MKKQTWQKIGCGVGAAWIGFGASLNTVVHCVFFVLGMILSAVSWISYRKGKDAEKDKKEP